MQEDNLEGLRQELERLRLENSQLLETEAERGRALQRSEERLHLLMENVRDFAIFMLDVQARIVDWNVGAERIFGYSAEEAIGQSFALVFTPEDIERGAHDLEVNRATTEGRSEDERWHLRKDGTIFWASGIVTALRDESGKLRGFAKIARDMTFRKRMEEQLLQSHKMESVGKLAGGVAHEFNNMLTAIIGYTEMAVNEIEKGNPAHNYLERVQQSAERSARLTRQLLAFARKQMVSPRIINLNDLIEEMRDVLTRILGVDNTVVLLPSNSLGDVKVDSEQIEQVLINMALNARDAISAGGKFILETSNVTLDEAYARLRPDVVAGEYVMLAISDNGSGIDEVTKSRIFDPFFTTKPVGEGTGLGLATCFGIVRQAGGYIWVYSEMGRGTTFKIYLPRVADVSEGNSVWKASSELPRGTETVLVAEDEPLVRDMTVRILREQGYTVLDAGNGEEAMELMEKFREPLHLLITDVVMPQIGGVELAKRLKTLYPDVRTLYISGFTEGAIATQGGLEAQLPFLQKPFTAAALTQLARRVLDERPS